MKAGTSVLMAGRAICACFDTMMTHPVLLQEEDVDEEEPSLTCDSNTIPALSSDSFCGGEPLAGLALCTLTVSRALKLYLLYHAGCNPGIHGKVPPPCKKGAEILDELLWEQQVRQAQQKKSLVMRSLLCLLTECLICGLVAQSNWAFACFLHKLTCAAC